ncbi:MAG: HAMP domain-containing sensor histidine kinase [Anaerolineales bacterium]|jgi:two-component system OmpR family sensor kinase
MRGGWLYAAAGILVAGLIGGIAVKLAAPDLLVRTTLHFDLAGLILALSLLLAALAALIGLWLDRKRDELDLKLDLATHQQEEERRRFIQRLDHELKNPLTAIQIQLDNLQAADSHGEISTDDLRVQVDRLSGLTRGLRRLADLETRALELEEVDLPEVLEEVIELLQAPARIELDIQRTPWPIPLLMADRELLLMAFRNLVDNALRYSQGPVEVRARHTAGSLQVEVIDTGRGIPGDEIGMVGEELYRGSNVHDVSGSGLGLSIVKRILERHGGKLELRSRAGSGTIASVDIPYE